MSSGKHLILDLYGCDPGILDDVKLLQDLMQKALEMAKATVIKTVSEKFEPQGVTILALLAESHASLHTWPEMEYCAIDLYTCGTTTDGDKAASYLKEKLKAQLAEEKIIVRSPTPLVNPQ